MTATEVTRKYFDSISQGDIEAALAQFAPNAKFVAPFGELPFPEGVRAYLGGYDQSFKGHGFRVTQIIEVGDQVAVEGFWHGTHSGPLMLPDGSQIAATGKTVDAPFVTMFTMRGDKIAEHRGYWDMAGFMGQLQG